METVIGMHESAMDTVTIPRSEYEEYLKLKKNAVYMAMLDRGFAAIERREPGIRKTMAELRAMENE